MAAGVKKRHSRWVLKAHYVLREDLELSGICTELLGFGKRARLTTYAPQFRDNSAPLAVANRAQWAEIWPFPEIGWSVPNNGEMQDVHLIPQETPDRDVFAELDQLRADVDRLKNPPIPWRESGEYRVDVYNFGELPSARVTHTSTGYVETNADTVSGTVNADRAYEKLRRRLAETVTCPACHETVCDPGCPCETIRGRHSE